MPWIDTLIYLQLCKGENAVTAELLKWNNEILPDKVLTFQ